MTMSTQDVVSAATERKLGGVLVTGGASGLGAAVVVAVADAGGSPLVLDRAKPGGEHPFQHVDLTDRDGVERAIRSLTQGQQLSAVVTCAGTDACGALTDVPADLWERVVATNLLGTASVIRAALPHLEPGGSIVTVASTLGRRALPDATAYCASKFGVVGFTRALGAELGDAAKVTCLIPGGMRTAFFDSRDEKYRPPDDADLMNPQEVAAVIVNVLITPGRAAVRELVLTAPGEPSWP